MSSGFALALCVVITGCQSGPPKYKERPEDPIEPVVLEPVEQGIFVPDNFIARVHFDEGEYTNLMAPTTHAIWVDKHMAEVKLAVDQQSGGDLTEELLANANTINENFIVIELHVETLFEDSSIAYDISSLRNMNVYLESDTGRRIYPIQNILGSSAGEEQVGALKRFNRLNILVFPNVDVITEQPTVEVGTERMQLAIEGFNSRYTFTWMGQGPAGPLPDTSAEKQDISDVITWRPNQTETYQLLKVRFTELYEKLGALTNVPRG